MKPRRGEVWWGEEPERERRPYVVPTRNSAIGTLSEVLVAVVTRTIRHIRPRSRSTRATACASHAR